VESKEKKRNIKYVLVVCETMREKLGSLVKKQRKEKARKIFFSIMYWFPVHLLTQIEK
jgi:hypothetical protein